MDLQQLDMLLAVVEQGGYYKAGQHLHVAHSAIHRRIRMLEQEVGERVLARAGRHMELTPAGRILTALANRLQNEIAAARREVADLAELHAGELLIGTGTAMLGFLIRVLKRFQKTFPKVQVHFSTGTADHIMQDVESRRLDLGIVFDPTEAQTQGRRLESEVLYREEFVWVVGRDHPLAGRQTTSLAQLCSYPFIMFTKSSHIRRMFERCFAEAGLTPRILMELENEEAIEEMLDLNMGIALLTRRRALRRRLHHLRVPGRQMVCPVCMVVPRQDYVPRAIREFAAMCRQAARPLSPAGHRSPR